MAQRILVINDTPEILELFEEILSEEGYEVVLYSYATHDTDEIVRHKPDLVILDYIFGTEKLGWQLLQKLKMRRETAGVPVIICTAAIHEVREIEGHLLAKGVTVVPKPFDIDELLVAVSTALATRNVVATLVDKDEGTESQGERSKSSEPSPPLRATDGSAGKRGQKRKRES